jgi:DNA-binding NtrC family response regulator
VTSKRRILVVDDAEGVRSCLASLLEMRDFRVDTAEGGHSALALLESGNSFDLIILDVMMPDMDGLETLRRIRTLDAEIPVVMLSAVHEASTIVEAMKLGASDYLNKPFEERELELTIAKAFETRDLEAERRRLRADLGPEGASTGTFWESETLQEIRELLELISDTDVTVLIQGESGVGKDIVARAVHATSARSSKPFVKVNCAALPAELLESELFGYEKGAFTGANTRKQGRFARANGGTIFLDEIAEMSPPLQAKLLQVLQDGTFTRLGANREVQVDVRLVTATNRPLKEMVEGKGFRKDLFFRLNVVSVKIPPLRERRDEIPLLVDHFLRRFNAEYGKYRVQLSARLMALFDRHPFPGNIRELENMIRRIVVLESEEPVVAELLSGRERASGLTSSAFADLLEEIEESAGDLPLRVVGRKASLEASRETIERVLIQTDWNRRRAARMLRVSYTTLLNKIRECGLTASDD